MSNTFVTVFIQ